MSTDTIFDEKWDKGESFTSGSYWKLGKGGVDVMVERIIR